MDHFILGSMFFGKDLENQRVVILNKKKKNKGFDFKQDMFLSYYCYCGLQVVKDIFVYQKSISCVWNVKDQKKGPRENLKMKDEMTCGEFEFFLYENGSLLANRVSLTLNSNIFTPARNNFKNIKWSRICQM